MHLLIPYHGSLVRFMLITVVVSFYAVRTILLTCIVITGITVA